MAQKDRKYKIIFYFFQGIVYIKHQHRYDSGLCRRIFIFNIPISLKPEVELLLPPCGNINHIITFCQGGTVTSKKIAHSKKMLNAKKSSY